MSDFKKSINANLEELTKNESLLNALIEVDGFFDNFHLYSYDNWLEGEVVAGPAFDRYWVTVILCFYKSEMPDPVGALALAKHGCKIRWKQSKRNQSVDVKKPEDLDDRNKSKMALKDIWLVEIKIPRRFIDGFDELENKEAEDALDMDAMEEAQDENLDDEAEDAGMEGEEADMGEEDELEI